MAANIKKINFTCSLCRVDPTIGIDAEQSTPLQVAARKGSLEIIALFAELVKDPKSSLKIRLLKLIIECEEEQDANVEAFKQQLESISEARSLKQSRELISFDFLTCRIIASISDATVQQVAQRDIVVDGNLLHFAVVNNLKEHVRILLKHGLVLSFCKSLALEKVSLYLVPVNWESEQIKDRKDEIILVSNQVRPKAQHASLL